ncbi:MAG: hypothetical protein RLZZ244_493 [Verrucomicrobiota bacterium]|jgi:mono/diheme cytochrome c family protein
MRPLVWKKVGAGLALLGLGILGAESAPGGAPNYLERYCVDCHDGDTRKGGLDLTALSLNFEQPGVFETWVKVHDRMAAGEMPPKKKTRPPEEATRALLHGLQERLQREDVARRAQDGRAAVRRLTRVEYQNALRDLLELPYLEVAELLPQDGQRAGFDKLGEALDFSEIQLNQYLAAAEKALESATCSQKHPPASKKERLYPNWIKFAQALQGGDGLLLKGLERDPRFALVKPEMKKGDRFEGNGIRRADFVKSNTQPVGLIRSSDPSKYRSFFYAAPESGEYRIRVSTWSFFLDRQRVCANDRTEVAALWSTNRLLGYFDAPSLAPKVQESLAWMRVGDGIRFETETVRHANGDIAQYSGPGIAVDWVEVEGPIHAQWPPASHRILFGDLPLEEPGAAAQSKARPEAQKGVTPGKEKAVRVRCTVTSKAPLEDAKRLLARFLPRAFRRPVSDAEVGRYVEVVRRSLAGGEDLERALKNAYRTALCSVHFLFREEQPGVLTGSALATRLALWLWSSVPDEELARVGASGELAKPEVLRVQVERMLKDPRAERFVVDFLNQWLNLRKIGETTPDRDLYPEFVPYLQDAMVEESRAYFGELLRGNLGVEHVVAGDFAMLNGSLAALYGIGGVDGHAIRRVQLPKGSERGGFITQGAVLKVTANGTTTSPVVRGAWFNERILGMTLPPPPPNVGSVEPDTRGATTIREQLEKHRRDASCAACHERIDPPGFALEAFDVIGGQRTRYRSLGSGTPVSGLVRDGQRAPHYKEGPAVDCAGKLPDGRPFANVNELRARLTADPDLLAKNLLSQLLVFATGSEIHFADRLALQRLVEQSRSEGHRVRSMIHLIAQSELFRSK